MRYRWDYPSVVGTLRLVMEDEQLVGVYFEQHHPAPRDLSGEIDASPFRAVTDQLDEYFAGDRDFFDVPLQFHGTEFQQQVWQQLQQIPTGTTVSYSELARRVGREDAVRAVAGAVGRNPISIIVPCHRVVGANGSLTGFAGGIERKRWLLERENAVERQLI